MGLEFTFEIRAAIRRAVENPTPTIEPLLELEVRRICSRGASYRIFHRPRDDAILVFVVLHAARHDPPLARPNVNGCGFFHGGDYYPQNGCRTRSAADISGYDAGGEWIRRRLGAIRSGFSGGLPAKRMTFAHYRLNDGVYYFLNDAQLIRDVLMADGNFVEIPSRRARHPRHSARPARQRRRPAPSHAVRLAQPAFHQGRLADYAGRIVDLSGRAAGALVRRRGDRHLSR